MPIIEMKREFVFGGSSLPDPDPTLTPEEVLAHYAKQYPLLKRGKVELQSDSGDLMIYELKKNEFQPDG